MDGSQNPLENWRFSLIKLIR